jgi:hypothetical protein
MEVFTLTVLLLFSPLCYKNPLVPEGIIQRHAAEKSARWSWPLERGGIHSPT